ncbi:MAG: ABC transporter permease [Alphaproteobacteria bacterium]
MLRFLVQRCLFALLTLFFAAFIIFYTIEILPGDPAQIMLGVNASPESLAALRTQLGLDRSVIMRFTAWIIDLAQLDFGISLIHGDRIANILQQRLTVTIPLALIALVFSTLTAFLFGSLSALYRRRMPDYLIAILSQVGIALPNFWLGILLILGFSVGLRWLPSGGFPGWEAGIDAGIRSLILPAIAIALPQAATLLRIVRTALIDSMAQDFYRTAQAKGLSPALALIKHGFRNALVPILTILGLQLAYLLAGVIVIENVFVLPGLGRLLLQATGQRDLIMIREIIFLAVVATILINLLIDIAYGFVDPRLRKVSSNE